MPVQSLDENGIKPYGPKVVFVEAKYCPAKSTTYAICKAAEKNQGVTCYGAQERAGLWRIQTNTDVGRIKLLAGIFEMNNKRIEIHERNPHLRGDVDDDAPSTKLNIDNLPFSFSNDAIDRKLVDMNIKIRTKIKMECDKDENGHMTEYRTGRRSVWINLPDSPLPRSIRIGNFQATLWHWEMKQRDVKCNKCFEMGHKAFQCMNEEKCLVCKLSGHRKGDIDCPGNNRANRVNPKVSEKPATLMQYQMLCEKCGEYGHETNDILCENFEFGWRPEAERDNQETSREQVLCKACGSPDHHESSITCAVTFPPLKTPPRTPVKRCRACNDTGHTEGNVLCKHFRAAAQNISNTSVEVETQVTQTVVASLKQLTENVLNETSFSSATMVTSSPLSSSNANAYLSSTVVDEDGETIRKTNANEITLVDVLSENVVSEKKTDENPAHQTSKVNEEAEQGRVIDHENKSVELYSIFQKNIRISPCLEKTTKRKTPMSSPDGHIQAAQKKRTDPKDLGEC